MMNNHKNHQENSSQNHGKDSQPYYPKAKMKNSILPISKNKTQKPKPIKNAVVKVPVVLGETRVQLDMATKIEFPEPVLEIKEVKKNLKLTQCRLLLPTNKLFLKGFVRKNIQYATPKRSSKEGVLSALRSYTIDIPFETVTEIDFLNKPQFDKNPDRQEFTYFTENKLPKGHSQKEHLLSGDFSQFDQISGEIFNELPYCELLSSHFIEYDEALDREMGRVSDRHGGWLEAPFEEGTFRKMEEKMVVELTLKVLQKQQVEVDEDFKGKYGKYDMDNDF